MKLIFTTAGNNLDAPLDPSFGRARNFLLYDPESRASQIISNQQNRKGAQGAGIQGGETSVEGGGQALITGHCGPKAFRVLEAAGVKVYNTDAPTISEALARFRAGQLTEATSANVEGHWA